jgi:hypothetical protein
MKKFHWWSFTIILIFLGLFFAVSVFRGCSAGPIGLLSNTFSEGYRDVYISKISLKGRAVKVYEGEGVPYGRTDAWAFNVEDKGLIDKLASFRGDELVRVQYQERHLKISSTTSYVITSAERVDDILPRSK